MILDFVGLTADLTHLRIALSADKITKSLVIIDKLLTVHKTRKFVKIKDLERCTGILNYACQAIPVGCPWLQSCYALQWAANDNVLDHTISNRVCNDLKMFRSFLEQKANDFIKSVPFLDRLGKIYNQVEIKADTTGNPQLGFGCFLPLTGQWFRKSWADTTWFTPQSGLHAHKLIYQLELFAITLAFQIFGPSLQGHIVILRCDNLAIVNSINNMSSQLEAPMKLLRELTLTCMSLQIMAKAVHIPGILNMESDLISRGKFSEFLRANPRSHDQIIEVTSSFWPPSWTPSMQWRSSGKTEFCKGKRELSGSSKKSVTGTISRWH